VFWIVGTVKRYTEPGTPERGCITRAMPPAFERGQRIHCCPSHNDIMGNSMIYQDRLETNLLKLFAHT